MVRWRQVAREDGGRRGECGVVAPGAVGFLLAIVVLVGSGAGKNGATESAGEGGSAASSSATAAAEGAGGGRGEQLRVEVLARLEQGEVSEALAVAQRALAKAPEDRGLCEEFFRLHLAVGRRMAAEENFAVAEAALHAGLAVVPGDRAALGLLNEIEAGRMRAPEEVARAKEWIEVEWFGPAFEAVRRARRLLPAREAEWSGCFVEAAIGAGDDQYLCKNFHEAFYLFDAARVEMEGRGSARRAGVDERWLFSMAQALGRDLDRADYPAEYWSMVLKRAEGATKGGACGDWLGKLLRGMAMENLGLEREAIEAYSAIGAPADSAAEGRRAGLALSRRWYDGELADRRAGFRRGGAKDTAREWKVLKSGRFRVHHRNEKAARRVLGALDFHFERISGMVCGAALGVEWPKRCDVFLYEDPAALRMAMGQKAEVRGTSVIVAEGGRLRRHAIRVCLGDPLLLSASLPHELGHLIVGAASGYRRLPSAVSEGLALTMECEARQIQFARLFREAEDRRSVEALLSCEADHPKDAGFYAEAHRLGAMVAGRGMTARVMREAKAGCSANNLSKLLGLRDEGELERLYQGATKE